MSNQLKNPEIGLPVVLHSLEATEFNGEIGLLNSDQLDDKGRYQVLLHDRSIKNIKQANLKNIHVRVEDIFNQYRDSN